MSLATLERDCFVIPAHALDRFLPDGVPVSYMLMFWYVLIKIDNHYFQTCKIILHLLKICYTYPNIVLLNITINKSLNLFN